MTGGRGEASGQVSARVLLARDRQRERRTATGVAINADLPPRVLREVARPDSDGEAMLRGAMERFGLSARGHDRVLRVARTLADLDGASSVCMRNVAEALQFRGRPSPAE